MKILKHDYITVEIGEEYEFCPKEDIRVHFGAIVSIDYSRKLLEIVSTWDKKSYFVKHPRKHTINWDEQLKVQGQK